MNHGFARALPFGACFTDADTARFRLWAPAEKEVLLEIEGASPQSMQSEPGGWFVLELACKAGARYRYRLTDGTAVPDPASRFQPDDIHGSSQLIDPHAYRWQHPQWRGRPWNETVLYEVHVGACGGYAGVIEQLPRLAKLGITAIELMPIADFPGQRNWGYDGVLPYAPDSAYGTPDELKALIDHAHGLGLMVFLDVVYNHFGPDGNFLHAYAPQFFDEGLHTPWGAAIDFKKSEVREFFTQNALYWLQEYRFDGLRFDAVHAISEVSFLDEMAGKIRASIEPDRYVHLVLENERNAASHLSGVDGNGFNAQWNDDGHNALHVLLTGETESYYANYADRPIEKLARVLGEGFAYQGEPMPSHDDRPRGESSAHLPPTAFVLFLQNHDQIGNRALGERLSRLADPRALRAAVALQLLCPQIPLLFMGEEWGSTQPFLFFTDFHDELADAVREGRRKEFAGFPAFADPVARNRIPDPNAPATFEQSRIDAAEAMRPPHAQILSQYIELLRLRRQYLIPRLSGARSLGVEVLGASALIAQWRLGDGARLSIICNLGDDVVSVITAVGEPIFATDASALAALASGELLPFSTAVFLESPA